MKTILSIDWDYFFPNFAAYDWGARADGLKEPFYLNHVWVCRLCDRLKPGGPRAVDAYHPDTELIDRMIASVEWPQVQTAKVAMSHAAILSFVRDTQQGEPCRIVNFDQHHDWAYWEGDLLATGDKEDCANWANCLSDEGLLAEYVLVYPEWRRQSPEFRAGCPIEQAQPWRTSESNVRVSFNPPADSAKVKPDHVFICQSPHWAAPWADDEWVRFVRRICGMLPNASIDTDCCAFQPRPLNYAQALQSADQLHRVIDQAFSEGKPIAPPAVRELMFRAIGKRESVWD